jgi:hypothetical protein
MGVFMNTGENWRYATMLLLLLLQASIVPLFFFYDINCRYAPYFLGSTSGMTSRSRSRLAR